MSTVAFTPNNSNNKENKPSDNYDVTCSLNNTFLEFNNHIQKIIAAAINNDICKIALGLQNCLYLRNLFIVENCHNNALKIDLLNQFLQLKDYQQLNANSTITIRQFIRLTFADLGIEVEFSGKNQYEKGVIIDVDEELAQKWGLNLYTLKQGQTVVKLAPN